MLTEIKQPSADELREIPIISDETLKHIRLTSYLETQMFDEMELRALAEDAATAKAAKLLLPENRLDVDAELELRGKMGRELHCMSLDIQSLVMDMGQAVLLGTIDSSVWWRQSPIWMKLQRAIDEEYEAKNYAKAVSDFDLEWAKRTCGGDAEEAAKVLDTIDLVAKACARVFGF